MSLIKKCLRCKALFEAKNIGKPNEKRFCSEKCRTRYNASKRYNKYKDNQMYKRKSRERFKEWAKEHREYHYLLVKKRYLKFKSKGLCVRCGSYVGNDHVLCSVCRKKQTEYDRKFRRKSKKVGEIHQRGN